MKSLEIKPPVTAPKMPDLEIAGMCPRALGGMEMNLDAMPVRNSLDGMSRTAALGGSAVSDIVGRRQHAVSDAFLQCAPDSALANVRQEIREECAEVDPTIDLRELERRFNDAMMPPCNVRDFLAEVRAGRHSWT